MTFHHSDDPETIKALADANERKMQARAQLHPVAQIIDTLSERLMGCINDVGCFIIILILIIVFAAPQIIDRVVSSIF